MEKKNNLQGKLMIIISAICAVIWLFPYLYLISSSFKPGAEVVSIPAKFFPKVLSVENFTSLFERMPVLHYIFNSFLVAIVSTLIAIILGAFGAHALKKVLSIESLSTFETGVKYQMYSALFLLIVGYILKFESPSEKWISILMIAGTFLFSVSIYLLAFSEVVAIPAKAIGPITPLGGLLMIVSWAMLIFYFVKQETF